MRDEHGAAAIMVALVTTFVLFIVAALAVDIGNTWARRGSLQSQADHAAKNAAEVLPVDSTTVTATPTTAQLKAAKTAAYYVACHPVTGQGKLSTIPSCPSASSYLTDSGIDTLARAMLTNGRSSTATHTGSVSFPTINEVKVTAPSAKVTYGLGNVAGVDDSVQSKSATAIVLSPGEVLPVGLSLTCMATSLGAVPLGAGDTVSTVMPVNYISTGFPQQTGTSPVTQLPSTPGDTDWSDVAALYNNHPATISLNTSSTSISATGAVSLTFNWTSGKSGFTVESIRIYIRKKGYVVGDPTGFYVVDVPIPLLQQGNTSGTTSVTLTLPPGDYEGLIRLSGRNNGAGALQNWINNSNQNAEFNVPETGELRNLVSCARPVQSPRAGFANGTDAGDRGAMPVNFAQGLDHGLQQFPGLGDAVDGVGLSASALPSSMSGLLAGPSSLFACDNNTRVKKDYSTRRLDGPNCLRVDTSKDWSAELTQGLLTGGSSSTGTYSGRLKCPSSGQCNFSSSRSTLSSPGGISGSYNDDHFSDFILKTNGNPRYLSDPFFMSLHAFTSNSLPLVTPPNDTVDQALYDSPRFFWAPVMLNAYTTKAAGDYSIMTFRPVFLTSDSSTQITTPIDMLLQGLVAQGTSTGATLLSVLTAFGQSATCLLVPTACQLAMLKLADITAPLQSYLGPTTVNTGGLVIDTTAGRVRAARVMTLAPGALPAVSRTYNGPVTTYLGVGPKIIRLTR